MLLLDPSFQDMSSSVMLILKFVLKVAVEGIRTSDPRVQQANSLTANPQLLIFIFIKVEISRVFLEYVLRFSPAEAVSLSGS